ncbi:MAG: hypothetical protein RL013_423 [Bacteroidota bacterium]
MLPAAGRRDSYDGSLNYRGYYAFYWSSTEIGSGSSFAWYLDFFSSSAGMNGYGRASGLSVRCIAE